MQEDCQAPEHHACGQVKQAQLYGLCLQRFNAVSVVVALSPAPLPHMCMPAYTEYTCSLNTGTQQWRMSLRPSVRGVPT